MFVFEAMLIDGKGEQKEKAKNEIEKKGRNVIVSHLNMNVDLVFLSHKFARERLKISRKVIYNGVKM